MITPAKGDWHSFLVWSLLKFLTPQLQINNVMVSVAFIHANFMNKLKGYTIMCAASNSVELVDVVASRQFVSNNVFPYPKTIRLL
jgi:hypothetical protein